jgi:hypothetical protein
MSINSHFCSLSLIHILLPLTGLIALALYIKSPPVSSAAAYPAASLLYFHVFILNPPPGAFYTPILRKIALFKDVSAHSIIGFRETVCYDELVTNR